MQKCNKKHLKNAVYASFLMQLRHVCSAGKREDCAQERKHFSRKMTRLSVDISSLFTREDVYVNV